MEKKKIIELLEKRIQATRDDYHRQMERHEKDRKQVAPNSVEAASRIRTFYWVKELLCSDNPLQEVKRQIKRISKQKPKKDFEITWNDVQIRTLKESLELVGMLNNKHNN